MYCSDMTERGAEKAVRASHNGVDRVRSELEDDQNAEESCSEAHLRRVAGEEDLEAVRNLALAIDTNETQVDHLGTLMPLLSELRLERGSTLASFRDLGSSLTNLRVLWLSACGIRHLDGVGALSGLEELYLAFNDVEDLTSIALHDRLEVLDLESNSVRDAEQAIQLGTCSRLWSLTLTANPVCRDRCYRRTIVEAVPQLASLDEEDITDDDRRPPHTANEADHPSLPVDIQQTSSKEIVPPHHSHLLLPKPATQQSPEGVKHTFSEPFPLGSTGTGNRNLRELEMSGSHCSHHHVFGGVETPTLSIGGVGPGIGSKQVVVPPQTCTLLSPSRYRWIPQPLGELPEDSRGDPQETATAVAECHGCFSESSRGSRDCGGEDVHADGVAEEEEARSDDNGGIDRRRETDGRLEAGAGCRHVVSSQDDDTATTFVDEEEMVVKAIKSFRLLSSAAKIANEDNNPSPRWCRAASQRATPSSITSSTIMHEWGGTRTAEENDTGTDGKMGGDDRSLLSSRDLEKNETFSTHIHARADVERIHGAGGERAPGNNDFCQGSDWLLKVLSLENMGPVSTPRDTYATAEGGNDAASSLTHGSQLSIAGNPAFGLRRRRVQDRTADTRTEANASTSALVASYKAETRQQVTHLADGGVDKTRVARDGAKYEVSRRHRPLTADGPTPARPSSAGAEEGCGCVSICGTPPKRELEKPSAGGGGRATTDGDGLDEEPPTIVLPAPALSWPLSGSSRDASFNNYGTPRRHTRQIDGTTLVGSLCCRALLSPPTRLSPQSLRYVRRRPALAAGPGAVAGAESFSEPVEASGVGACSSPPSGAARSVADVGAVVANVYNRARFTGRPGARQNRNPCGVLNSRSAACLIAQTRTEIFVGHEEGGRQKGSRRMPDDLCGAACTSSSLCIDVDHPDGGGSNGTDNRNGWRDGEGIKHLDGGLSNTEKQGGSKTRRGPKPSEVPEWSPTSNIESDSGVDRNAGQNGRNCDGRGGDFGFRCSDDAGEQVLHGDGGGGGRDDGGRVSGGDGGAGVAQPFAPMEATREAGGGNLGEGVSESDEKLVALLRERPKNVPQIRTRDSFRRYFRGMDRERLGRLLREAYADRGSVECDAKVKKRLMLLERSLDVSFR